MSSPPVPVTPYPEIFLAHAVLATLAWGFLAPLGHILSRLNKPDSPTRAFTFHRFLMLLTLLLTILVSVLGFLFSSDNPPLVHGLLATALLLLTTIQATMGALRPREKTGQHRMLWRAAHRTVGATTMALGAFLVHHSLIVFQVERWPSISVNGLLVVMACAVVAVHVFIRKPSADGPHHAYTAVSAQDDIDVDHAVLLDFDQDKQETMA